MDAIIEAQKELISAIHNETNMRVYIGPAEDAEYPYMSLIELKFHDNGSKDDTLYTVIFTFGIFTKEKTSKAAFKILKEVNEIIDKKNIQNQYYNIWFSFTDSKFVNLSSTLFVRYTANIECL